MIPRGADFVALLPLMIVAVVSLFVTLSIAIRRNHRFCAALTVAGFAAAFVSLWPAMAQAPRVISRLLLIDRYGIFYMGLLLGASLCVTLLAFGYLSRHQNRREEF